MVSTCGVWSLTSPRSEKPCEQELHGRSSPAGSLELSGIISCPLWTLVQWRVTLTHDRTDRSEQELVVARLAQVRGGSGVLGALPRRDVVKGGDEDDRDDDLVGDQVRLKLETAHPTVQMDVQHQARGQGQRRRAQKIFRRCEALGGEAGNPNQPTKRSADRVIVVNDRN